MNFISSITVFVLFLSLLDFGNAIWCYRCTSSTPGCAENFNWRGIGYLGDPCPEDDDICVKITERKGVDEYITRDCLSAIRAIRTDIPADHYEGCRPYAKDVRLAHYVNNTIKELDIKRDHFDNTEFCFCFLDHRCNDSAQISSAWPVLSGVWLLSIIWNKIKCL